MTEKELRELDAEIHRKVMGKGCAFHTPTEGEFGSDLHGWYTDPQTTILPEPVPHYSTDIAAAWLVMERVCRSEVECVTGNPNDGASQLNFSIYPNCGWVCQFWTADDSRFGEGEGEVAPLAICRAALAAVTEQPEAG